MAVVGGSFSRFIGYYVSSKGMAATAGKIAAYLRPASLAADFRVVRGIRDGRRAFQGPRFVQIDLTDDCNNSCIGCWCNSPLHAVPAVRHGVRLDYNRLENVIAQCRDMGTEEITLSGGGEPSLYPRFLDVVRAVKRLKMRCVVYTNLAAFTSPMLEDAVSAGLDMFAVSVWAHDAVTYALVHPGADPAFFTAVCANLRHLSAIRRRPGFPVIRINQVINRLNYRSIPAMARFAGEVGADETVFTVTDSIPGVTDSVLLRPEELSEVARSMNSLDPSLRIEGRDDFVRRCAAPGAPGGEYEGRDIQSAPCYTGWFFCRILADGSVVPCLKAHKCVTGNIYESDMRAIWDSERFRDFREAALVCKSSLVADAVGNGPGGCARVCDDAARNVFIRRRLELFPTFRFFKGVLAMARKARRIPLGVWRAGGLFFLFSAVAVYGIAHKFLRLLKRGNIFPGE